ncbi:MAG: 3-isopropylmalate dehydrogenase [Balneolaceae bacterium]
MKNINLVTLPGDGIGTEVTEGALTVLEKACGRHNVRFDVKEYPFGGSSLDRYGVPVTGETLEACKNSDAVLLGAVGGEKWDHLTGADRPESGLLKLRSELGVFANFRPVRIYPDLAHASSLKPEIISDVDILIVRELTGGIYFGQPRTTDLNAADPFSLDTMKYHKSEIIRVAEKAFEAAKLRDGRVCSVDKANVLGSSRFWRDTVVEFAKRFPDIELSHMLVDNCAMQLIRNPKQFDVILTSNLFGDILSDEAAMLTGSIGMLPSASLGNGPGLYEPVHGSAPDIAGQNKANPLAAIASAALLCRYSLDLEIAAGEIEAAVEEVLAGGYRTGDIYTGADGERLAGTDEVCSQVLAALDDVSVKAE